MTIPEVHELGARVLVHQEGVSPFESHVTGMIGDAVPGMALDRNAEYYWVAPGYYPKEGIPAHRVKRIVQVNMPGGDTFEGACYGVVRDGVDDDGPISMYNISYLHTPTVVVCVNPAWARPL